MPEAASRGRPETSSRPYLKGSQTIGQYIKRAGFARHRENHPSLRSKKIHESAKYQGKVTTAHGNLGQIKGPSGESRGSFAPLRMTDPEAFRPLWNAAQCIPIVANPLALNLSASSKQSRPWTVRSWFAVRQAHHGLTLNGLDGLTAKTERPWNVAALI